MKKQILILALLLFPILQSFALEVNRKVEHYQVEFDEISILKDKERTYSIDDVMSNELKDSFTINK